MTQCSYRILRDFQKPLSSNVVVSRSYGEEESELDYNWFIDGHQMDSDLELDLTEIREDSTGEIFYVYESAHCSKQVIKTLDNELLMLIMQSVPTVSF